MMAAAAITPVCTNGAPKPFGMNGVKLSASNAGRATATNTASAAIFTSTSTAFRVALSFVPSSSRPVTTPMIATAGRLMIPPACGPAVSAAGRSTPSPLRKATA